MVQKTIATGASKVATNKTTWIIVGSAAALLFMYFIGKKIGKGKIPPKIKLPNNGSGIPQGWTATASVRKIHTAMEGAGTDEDAIWATLEDKTNDQLVAIYNEFGRLYKDDLLQWFEDDLSGSDLNRALGYFEGLI